MDSVIIFNNTKRTLLIFILVIITLFSSFIRKTYAGWPFNKTPAIEGVVRDATTGEPIENVKVNFCWTKTYIIRVPPDGVITRAIAKKNVLTDKEGRYRIPSKISFHLLSYFDGASIAVYHPLYEFYENKAGWNFYKKDYKTKKWVTIGEMRDGIINYNFELVHVEDKYVKVANKFLQDKTLSNEERKKDIYALCNRFNSFVDFYSPGRYFVFLRSKGKLDLDKIIKTWKYVAEKIAYDEASHDKLMKDIKRTEKKIKKRLASETDE